MDYEGKTKKRKLGASDDGTAPNTSSASNLAGEFEVFLSFRGIDTRDSFTDYLYNDLVSAGIRTFRDDNELRIGEKIGPELLRAINKSKICIPIFSKSYASSKWCLLELTQMVESQTIAGQKILPIFYDVVPRDIRHQTGSYEEAFRQHHQRFDEKTVEGWKEAMRKVGELKGWELMKESNGRQGEFVKMIVSAVLFELKKNYMVVTDNLVGIDHHVEKMMGLLNVVSNDVRIVGIHGMGGIGKTTIAKIIYNKLSEEFDYRCFLANVREMSQHHNDVLNLQKQLISKIRKAKCDNIADAAEGINAIKDIVCNKKVLFVLDDVYEESQFANLAGKRDWFGSGSRIIVTTRNKEVLEVLEVDGTYEPQPMEHDHALQLFSKHAFRNDFPPEDFQSLSRDVVSTTGMLPLALEIIGSLLFRKGKVVWEGTLKQLKNIPNPKIMEKLRISYEALEHEEKQIFLDIACHFIGEDKTLPSYMWDDCKFYPTTGINVLVYRSLLKIEDGNVLGMHDLIRDLGRAIIREVKDLEEYSRLWIHEEALDILEHHSGSKKVEVLCLGMFCFTGPLTNDHFGKLQNLRFLQVLSTTLTGDFKHLLSNLRWLQWWGCTENSKPINFHLKNLVILDLSCSCITENWEGWSQIQMSKKLKVLNLSSCKGLTRTPDFSTFVNLERLILLCCDDLVEIDSSIGNLINLRVLDISCTSIRKLPDAIGYLEKLEEIYASKCRSFDGVIPSTIGRLSYLRILNFNTTRIHSLPTSICGLSRLQTLDLISQCDLLQLLPVPPPSLRSLCLTCHFCSSRYCFNYPLPSSIECHISRNVAKLSIVKALCSSRSNISTSAVGVHHLMSCTGLWCIQGLPSRFLELYRIDCKLLERLPNLRDSRSLSKKFMLHYGSELMEIQGIGKLELWSVIVCWCTKLAKLDGLEQLKSLRCLRILYCESLERLPNLSNLKNLQELAIYEGHKLKEISGLVRLESLKCLVMTKCGSIERLPDLSNLGMLKRIDLSYCEKLVEVGGLGGLISLETLDMSGCRSIEKLPDLSYLGMLKRLDLSYCEKLVEVRGLGGLKFLGTLGMLHCKSLRRLPDLSNLKILKELRISGEKNLTDVRGLEELESLEFLSVGAFMLPERSLDLSKLQKLKELKVFWYEKLPEIRGLEKMKSLRLLELCGSKSIEKFPYLSSTKILPCRILTEFGSRNL